MEEEDKELQEFRSAGRRICYLPFAIDHFAQRDLSSVICHALRSAIYHSRSAALHPFDALEACSGQAFHQSPFTVPLTLFPSRLRELLRKLKSNLA
jgi:hypothetical protein